MLGNSRVTAFTVSKLLSEAPRPHTHTHTHTHKHTHRHTHTHTPGLSFYEHEIYQLLSPKNFWLNPAINLSNWTTKLSGKSSNYNLHLISHFTFRPFYALLAWFKDRYNTIMVKLFWIKQPIFNYSFICHK